MPPPPCGPTVRRVAGTLLAGALATLVLIGSHPAAAAGATTAAAAAQLTISPARLTIPYGGGTPVSRVVTVSNGSALPVGASVQALDEQQQDSSHTVYTDPKPGSVASWISVDHAQLQVPAQGSATFTVTVRVPPATDAGELQAAVLVTVPAQGAVPGQIRINVAAAVQVFISGSGVVRRSLALESLQVPGIAAGGPMTITVAVVNDGTVHEDLSGSRRLSVDIGDQHLEFPDMLLSRGEHRTVSAQLTGIPWFCVCTAIAQLPLPDGGFASTSARTVMLPSHAGVLGAGLLALILGAVGLGLWGHRRRGRSASRLLSAKARR